MPPKGKLDADKIATLTQWVKIGLPWPKAPPTASVHSSVAGSFHVRPEDRQFWSLQPVTMPPLPTVRDTAWPRTGVDAFILAKLEAGGVAPAPPADKGTLLRRVTFDLIGLPPTPDEVDAFLADVVRAGLRPRGRPPARFAALRRAVGPALARRGPLRRGPGPHVPGPAISAGLPLSRLGRAWPSTRDMPYDRLRPTNRSPPTCSTGRTAPSGWRPWASSPAGRSTTATRTARPVRRPHRHADPRLPRADGRLRPLPRPQVRPDPDRRLLRPGRASSPAPSMWRRRSSARKKSRRSTRLRRNRNARTRSRPKKYPFLHALQDKRRSARTCGSTSAATRDAGRGSAAAVPVESSAGESPQPFARGSGRLELAAAIASPDNPLTARVMVNRVWQHHFGRGLVRTPSNFGILGERPTHPELLDYLAARFVAPGWSLKATAPRDHALGHLSAVSRRAIKRSGSSRSREPLVWRMNRRRLEVEAWRDAMLAVSGRLDRTLGGPSVDLADADNRRRTLYGRVSRHDSTPCCGCSTSPTRTSPATSGP